MISIVDDDRSLREATKGLVRSFGYGADAFASAEEFLQSDRVNDTSCLILDVNMPGLSGIDLQKQLIAQGNRMPIIFITAAPEESTRDKALKAGRGRVPEQAIPGRMADRPPRRGAQTRKAGLRALAAFRASTLSQ